MNIKLKSVQYLDEDWTFDGKRNVTIKNADGKGIPFRRWTRLRWRSRNHRASSLCFLLGKTSTTSHLQLLSFGVCMHIDECPLSSFCYAEYCTVSCGFDVGNRHHNADGAASVVDTLYDFFRTRLGQHVVSLNPVTGRPRQFFSSSDKGTEVN